MSKDDDSDRGVDWLTSQFGDTDKPKAEPGVEGVERVPAVEPVESIEAAHPGVSEGPPSAVTSVPPIAPFRRRREPAAPAVPVPAAPEPAAPRQPDIPGGPVMPEPVGFDSVLRSAQTQAELEPDPWWTTPVPAASAAAAAIATETPAETLAETPAVVPAQADDVERTSSAHALPADLHLGATLPAPLGTAGAAASTAEDVGSEATVSSRHSSPPASRKATRIVIWVGAVLLAAIVLVGLFLLGQRLAGTATPVAVATPTATATPTPTPTPTPIAEVTAMQPAGEHAWNTLFGGECLQPYVSPWEENFTVSDCAAAHGAQLVYRGSFGGDGATVFPGEAALAAQMNVLCSAPGVLDLTAAGAYPDLQVQGSYPITEEQWTDTARNYYCFVSRSSAEPLTVSVAGPGPTA